jgi:hypothetical protein
MISANTPLPAISRALGLLLLTELFEEDLESLETDQEWQLTCGDYIGVWSLVWGTRATCIGILYAAALAHITRNFIFKKWFIHDTYTTHSHEMRFKLDKTGWPKFSQKYVVNVSVDDPTKPSKVVASPFKLLDGCDLFQLGNSTFPIFIQIKFSFIPNIIFVSVFCVGKFKFISFSKYV